MNKKISAKLKEEVTVAVSFDVDFTRDWLNAASIVDHTKEMLLHQLKTRLHEKIAVLSLNDVQFKILE